MNLIIKIFLSAIILFVIVSCDNIVEPIIPNDIQNFVNNLNLEDPQKIKVIMNVSNEDVYVFSVPYGPPQDCPSGCFYDYIYGLKNKNKIAAIKSYNIDENDTYLFSDNFWELLKNKDEWIYYSKFLPLLASDEDTPIYVLSKIANLLNNYISTHIAYNLLDNSAVKKEKEILIILSNLPIFNGDPYKDIREIANNLLGN
ncbi:MAG: hypothetical protein KKF62_18530 [Bacteroidetes bacterium]|nr:hypothetical protein [Bacteroidota bacterium]MBU1114381.1 hypothetical protein [Bacteroidota bacterium]MBU1798324.1 hypothetical protein [Bacteroidota bacterium]